MGFFQTCRYKYRSDLQRVFKFASSCFKSNMKRKHFITARRTSLGESRLGLFSPTAATLTVGHAKLWEKRNFQPAAQTTGDIFQELGIQKVSPPAGTKHTGAVCCPAFRQSGLSKDGSTLKMETY